MIRVTEEVEDQCAYELDDVLSIAQVVYENKISEIGIKNVTVPNLIKMRQRRLVSWVFIMFLSFSLLLLPAYLNSKSIFTDRGTIQKAMILNAVLFLPVFIYSFYRSPYKQLNRLLNITNKKILKQIK
jgi:hypothetical protein